MPASPPTAVFVSISCVDVLGCIAPDAMPNSPAPASVLMPGIAIAGE
jgi:hypothetical protein